MFLLSHLSYLSYFIYQVVLCFLLSHLSCYLSYFIVMLLLSSYFYFYLSYYFYLFIFRVLSLFLLFIGLGPIPSRSKIWAQNGLRRGPKLEPNGCHTSQTAGKRPAEPSEPLSNLAIRPLAHKKQTMSRLALEAQKKCFLFHVRGPFVCMLVMQCKAPTQLPTSFLRE